MKNKNMKQINNIVIFFFISKLLCELAMAQKLLQDFN